ncbi:MAG: hypothetical protein E6J74_10295 [Deltaproteobacteria bacterium]|nr:MAG: hypothetical protein E6J74_10295 [Deltaproteobacteria bacterium]
MDDPKKQARIDEVKALLVEFSKQHLASAPDVVSYIEKLWDQIGRKRSYVITGGTKEVWASAVVYVIARLNFLFDKARPNYLTADTICGHFGTKKGTVSARAAEIEKACRIRVGHEGLCRPEISDELTFVELSNGMVLPKRIAKEMGIL